MTLPSIDTASWGVEWEEEQTKGDRHAVNQGQKYSRVEMPRLRKRRTHRMPRARGGLRRMRARLSQDRGVSHAGGA